MAVETTNKMSKTMRLDILPSMTVHPSHDPSLRASSPGADRPEFGAALFQQLFQYAYDATLITDMQGTVLEGNRRAHEFLAGEQGVLDGLNVVQIISGADDELVAKLATSLVSERFARIHAWCHHCNGSYFPAEIAVHRVDVEGQAHLCFFIRDIAWRKEAEERLQTVNTAFRHALTGIAVADLEGRLVYANPAMSALCKYAPDDLPSDIDLVELVEDAPVVRRMLDAVLASETWHGEVVLRGRDESLLTTECNVAGNVDTEGQLIGMVLSFVDVSDRLRARSAERAMERNRIVMESLGSVCHHLGQPSTVLLSSVEMMLRLKNKQPPELEELLRLSLSAAESLRTSLRELNDVRQYNAEPYLSHSAPGGHRIVSLVGDACSRAADSR